MIPRIESKTSFAYFKDCTTRNIRISNQESGTEKIRRQNRGRFAINSTVGVLGFFDVAKHWGLERNYQDFGVTLGRWGVDPGPYVVLPVLGASNVRDTFGWVPDIFFNPVQFVGDDHYRYSLILLDMVDTRADLLSVEELITGDRYVFIRNAWLQQRQFVVSGETPIDDFATEDF